MKAARIHKFGSPDVIVIEEVPTPVPGSDEVLVRVGAAGVGPWDALIRENKSQVSVSFPIILGSDLAGKIEAKGNNVSGFHAGDAIYGVTNPQFIGAYAEFAIAKANMIGLKPKDMNDVDAASVPVVAVTAWQMVFDYAKGKAGQTVLVHGGAGNVGAYAVQLAKHGGLRVIATASAEDAGYLKSLGAETVLDYRNSRFEDEVPLVDIVIDTVGGDTRTRSFKALKPGGWLVSSVSPFSEEEKAKNVRTAFFLVEVTTERLNAITDLFNHGRISTQVGNVLTLAQARTAHEMLGGAPHNRGKIVLRTP